MATTLLSFSIAASNSHSNIWGSLCPLPRPRELIDGCSLADATLSGYQPSLVCVRHELEKNELNKKKKKIIHERTFHPPSESQGVAWLWWQGSPMIHRKSSTQNYPKKKRPTIAVAPVQLLAVIHSPAWCPIDSI